MLRLEGLEEEDRKAKEWSLQAADIETYMHSGTTSAGRVEQVDSNTPWRARKSALCLSQIRDLAISARSEEFTGLHHYEKLRLIHRSASLSSGEFSFPEERPLVHRGIARTQSSTSPPCRCCKSDKYSFKSAAHVTISVTL